MDANKSEAGAALGRLAAGVPKNYGEGEIALRTKRLLQGAARARRDKKRLARVATKLADQHRKDMKRAKHQWDRADKRNGKVVAK